MKRISRKKMAHKKHVINKSMSTNELKKFMISSLVSDKKKVQIQKWLDEKAKEDEKYWPIFLRFFGINWKKNELFEVAKANLYRNKSPYVVSSERRRSDRYDESGHRMDNQVPTKCSRQLYFNVDEYGMGEMLSATLGEMQKIQKGYYKARARAKIINPKAQSLEEVVKALTEGE